MITVLTLDPLLVFPLSLIRAWLMAKVCKSYATTGGRIQVKVSASSSLLDKNGIARDAVNLDRAIRAQTGAIVVLAYSRGCQVVGNWLRDKRFPKDIDPGRLRFILIGNPERTYRAGVTYIDGTQLKTTPTDSPYTIWDVARCGDYYADRRPDVKDMQAQLIHAGYGNVDLDHLPEPVTTIGNTQYYLVA